MRGREGGQEEMNEQRRKSGVCSIQSGERGILSFSSTDCFEGGLQWFEWPEARRRRERYRGMLLDQLRRAYSVEGESEERKPCAFLVLAVKDGGYGRPETPVGFAQVGLLPPPPGLTEASDGDPADVPYVANLCVTKALQGRGVGGTLVDICTQWLRKNTEHGYVVVAVESDNDGAQAFYRKKNFEPVVPHAQRPLPSSPSPSLSLAQDEPSEGTGRILLNSGADVEDTEENPLRDLAEEAMRLQPSPSGPSGNSGAVSGPARSTSAPSDTSSGLAEAPNEEEQSNRNRVRQGKTIERKKYFVKRLR